MPGGIAVAGLAVGALARADRAGFEIVGIGRAIIQMSGADLDIPADGVDDQRQDAGVVDEVEKGVVLRQGVADLEVGFAGQAISF